MDGRDARRPLAGPETDPGLARPTDCDSVDLRNLNGPQIGAECSESSTVKQYDGREICSWCPYKGCGHCRWQGGA